MASVLHLARASGITFTVQDVVDVVERDLPARYPSPTAEGASRRALLVEMAQAVLSGELYEA